MSVSGTELTKKTKRIEVISGKKIKGYGNLLAGWAVANSGNMLDMVLVKLVTINQNAVFYWPFHRGFASQLVSSCDRKMPTLNATAINNPCGCSSFRRGILTRLICKPRHLWLLCRPLRTHRVNSIPGAFTANSSLLLCEKNNLDNL